MGRNRSQSARQRGKNREIRRTVFMVLIAFVLLTIGILLTIFAADSFRTTVGAEVNDFTGSILIPYWIMTGVILLLMAVIPLLKWMRCPHCGKFFYKGELEFLRRVEGSSQSVNSGGDIYFRQASRSYWKTKCKYCRRSVTVTKGG